MYAVSNVNRVYISFLLLLCAAFFLAPSVANANEYWSVLEKRWIPESQVSNDVKEMLGHKVARPSGSTLSTVPSAPTISKNPTGGLSASTNNILKTLDQPSNFSATSNWSAASAKTALKSCVRSPACAGRALGTGAVIYEGITAWKEVYGMLVDPNSGIVTVPATSPEGLFQAPSYPTPLANLPSRIGLEGTASDACPVYNDRGERVMACWTDGNFLRIASCGDDWATPYPLVGISSNRQQCQYAMDDPWEYELPRYPISEQELDNALETYEPAVSDAPIVLLSGEPETITLTNPEPANLPATTTTSTTSSGTTTSTTNRTITYNVLNNNTSNPSIESSVTETTTTYDDMANMIGTSTSTTTNPAIQHDVPTAGASSDIEFPAFCTWAKTVCDWLGWTQEELGEEDPDLSQLITVFEPDEEGFDVGIGSGSCPAPMLLNLGIIGKTVEVKYDPFCSFLEMIKPFVLAAAYLFAAYLYIGVLKRG